MQRRPAETAVAASGIAQGFSGSPVYCPDRTGAIGNAGAISEGIGEYGNKGVLAPPIEAILGAPPAVPPPAGPAGRTRAPQKPPRRDEP